MTGFDIMPPVEGGETADYFPSDFVPPAAEETITGLDALLPARPETLPMKPGWKPGAPPERETLFDALKAVRARLSSLHRVPPYIICEDKTLRGMAESFPLTPTDLMQVHGMGATRVAKYGGPFLQAIETWLSRHPEQRPQREREARPGEGWTPAEEARLLLELAEGRRLSEVAVKHGRSAQDIGERLRRMARRIENPSADLSDE